ncbi:MAG: GtrA family protein [Candidatus Doudnabacteria bacterium]|nr:GtrA family protein [Candidatus Doudnabacteria bacterium]
MDLTQNSSNVQPIENQTLLQKHRALILQFLRFAVVGVINTAINFAIFNLLIWATGVTKGPMIVPMTGAAFLAANINSYLLNRKWTFKDNSNGEGAKQFSVYLSVSIVGALINIGCVFLLTTYIPPLLGLSEQLWANLANLVATGLSLIWNFVGYKLIVFKKSYQ